MSAKEVVAAYWAAAEARDWGDWHLAVERITGGEHDAASVIRFSDANGTQLGVCFFDLGPDGLIKAITDFWPEPYEPPANRAHLTERY